jgi:hypothetical protein
MVLFISSDFASKAICSRYLVQASAQSEKIFQRTKQMMLPYQTTFFEKINLTILLISSDFASKEICRAVKKFWLTAQVHIVSCDGAQISARQADIAWQVM